MMELNQNHAVLNVLQGANLLTCINFDVSIDN